MSLSDTDENVSSVLFVSSSRVPLNHVIIVSVKEQVLAKPFPTLRSMHLLFAKKLPEQALTKTRLCVLSNAQLHVSMIYVCSVKSSLPSFYHLSCDKLFYNVLCLINFATFIII